MKTKACVKDSSAAPTTYELSLQDTHRHEGFCHNDITQATGASVSQ